MEQFLISSFFKYCVFPIGSAMLGVYVKYTSRNDQYSKFKKEDIAVGLELVLTACLMFVLITTDRAVKLIKTNESLSSILSSMPPNITAATELQAKAQLLSSQIASSGWFITLMFLGLWSLSTVVRKYGWKSETEMNPILGIALPLSFGIFAIIVVMAGASQ